MFVYNAQLSKKLSTKNGDISTCRGCTRKSCSAVSKNICHIVSHMGLHTEVPFLYKPHISTVTLLHILVCDQWCVLMYKRTVKRNGKLFCKDEFCQWKMYLEQSLLSSGLRNIIILGRDMWYDYLQTYYICCRSAPLSKKNLVISDRRWMTWKICRGSRPKLSNYRQSHRSHDYHSDKM